MPCHAATFSAGDITTIISLLVFLLGLAGLSVVWVSGSVSAAERAPLEPEMGKAVGSIRGTFFPIRMLNVVKIMALDVFLQRRLFRQSKTRWFIHAMIFFPFMFRFLWGITGLLTSLWIPDSPLPWMLLDKDYPLGAFLADLTGLLILLGVIFTALRRIVVRPRGIAGLPKQDWLALCLIGSTVVIGFILEGTRIAMEGSPAGVEYAFLGYSIGRLFENPPILPNIYGYIWHLHAIATGAVLAYLPFSNLLHIVMAPVVIAVNAMSASFEPPQNGLVGRKQVRGTT
jgi:nitrate reductase gamma subunit